MKWGSRNWFDNLHYLFLIYLCQDLGEENPDESGIAFSSDKTADDSTLEKE